MRRNDQIRISPVRVIDQENEQLGIMPVQEALRIAQDAGLDLVEVAPNVRPPVCRIMDYGKHKYQQKKKLKKSHEQQLKEVRLRPKTDDNDREIKVKRATRFLKKGDKVQFTMRFRGRERAHREIAFDILRNIAAEFGQRVKIERPPSMDGRNMIMVLAPAKGATFDDIGEPEGDEADHDTVDSPETDTPETDTPETEAADESKEPTPSARQG
jgi:translation initiation factor IF-3